MGVELEKRSEKVRVILEKRGVTRIPPIRVGAALDVSGSTQDLYYNGTMQKTFDRLLGVALRFDDNGELDLWCFDDRTTALPTATASDESTYIRRRILEANLRIWSGTNYAPPLRAVVGHYFGSTSTSPQAEGGFLSRMFGGKKSETKVAAPAASTAPAMLLFITDGDNQDEGEAERELVAAQRHNVYFNTVGVGRCGFRFLRRMADAHPNVGFTNLSTLSMTDDELYESLINPEFCDWIRGQP